MTRSMTRWTMAGALALAALESVAVLGVGSTTAEAAPGVSPFAGSWSGTWAHIEDEEVGTFDWTISDAGRISGTVANITNPWSGAIVGHVRADGKIVLCGAAPNDVHGDFSGLPHQGTAVIDGDGKLNVSATGTWSSGAPFVATLERN